MQGFNMGRYVPPDQEGITSGNALNKKHPLGSRASKLASHGILTVRFEMPFAVWCDHCPKPTIIGQGVRFNAHKKRAGSYYTSPIWSFTIKHAACGGEIEIRTDPQNTAYVVVSGGRRRDMGSEDDSLVKAGDFVIATERERAEQREAAFGQLEKTIADRELMLAAGERIGELQDAAARQWDDPYAQNQRLRKAFRVGRHEREKEAAKTEDLRDRMGLDIELLPGTEEDVRRAALVDFGAVDDTLDTPVEKALARPLFEDPKKRKPTPEAGQKGHKSGSAKEKQPKGQPKTLKAEIAADKMRETLFSEILGNTRAARDPFLEFGKKDGTPKGPALIPGLKRKRTVGLGAEEQEGVNEAATAPDPEPPAATTTSAKTLVSYDSDSD